MGYFVLVILIYLLLSVGNNFIKAFKLNKNYYILFILFNLSNLIYSAFIPVNNLIGISPALCSNNISIIIQSFAKIHKTSHKIIISIGVALLIIPGFLFVIKTFR